MALAVAALTLVATLPQVTPPAGAEVETPWDGTLDGVDHDYSDDSPIEWGFGDLDPGSDNFIYKSYVYAITQIGDRIYMGGRFREVTDGNVAHPQAYLAAFDVTTGEWIPEFAPDINWSVFALAPSPDGSRLFVGGEFTDAGAPGSAAFAALDPLTGAIDPSFDVEVTRRWSGENARVHALDIHDNWLYIGGAFSHVEGAGATVQSSRLARVALDSGRADTTWRPQLSGGSVWEIEASSRGDRVYAGGTFALVGGVRSQAFAVVDTVGGSLVPGFPTGFGLANFPHNSYPFVATIVENGDVFWAGGQRHNLVIADRDDFDVRRTFQTNAFGSSNGRGGDFQAMALAGDVLFASCHCWGRMRELGTSYQVDVRSVVAFDASTGDHLDWYAPEMGGQDGGWALHVSHDACLWIGSDIYRSGSDRTRGLVRHCPTNAPPPPPPPPDGAPTVPDNFAGMVVGSDVDLTWDAVPGATSYLVYRDGMYLGWSASPGYRDTAPPDGSYQYQLRAVNGDGRSDKTPSVTVVVGDDVPAPPAVPEGLTAQPQGTSVVLSWTAVPGARSYLIYRNGAYIGWSATPGYTDTGVFAGPRSYQLRATNAWGRSDKTPPVVVVL